VPRAAAALDRTRALAADDLSHCCRELGRRGLDPPDGATDQRVHLLQPLAQELPPAPLQAVLQERIAEGLP